MRKGKLRYLGLLGFVGLIGVFIGEPGLYGFFGFFGFFAVTFQQQDELLEQNLNKAGMNGFVVSMLGLALAIMIVALSHSFQWLPLMVGIVFALQILTFTISLLIYEKKGGVVDDE
ncbi:MAG: DUF3796 domain-containing protein [Bacillota bacterium]|nr:DUF3796 domain-containing protein [Bacillota bacterium]MDW7678658.1 DUF3796 domain-containing protein [Bacillota bacterium]